MDFLAGTLSDFLSCGAKVLLMISQARHVSLLPGEITLLASPSLDYPFEILVTRSLFDGDIEERDFLNLGPWSTGLACLSSGTLGRRFGR
jgi:hypothetical protein